MPQFLTEIIQTHFLKIIFQFGSKWIILSEVHFETGALVVEGGSEEGVEEVQGVKEVVEVVEENDEVEGEVEYRRDMPASSMEEAVTEEEEKEKEELEEVKVLGKQGDTAMKEEVDSLVQVKCIQILLFISIFQSLMYFLLLSYFQPFNQ